MVLVEVYLGLRKALIRPIIQVILVYHQVFIVMVILGVDRGLSHANFSYNHGVLNILHPRFPQEAIQRGAQGENLHQNHPYYYHPSMLPHPKPIRTKHPNHNKPPHIYPSIPPHTLVCVNISFLLLCMQLM